MEEYNNMAILDEIKENISSYNHRKEFFRTKNSIVFQNDITEKNLFDKEFIDLIVTSPPYNVGINYNSNNDELNYDEYLEFTKKWISNCYNWSKEQARFLLNIPLDKIKEDKKALVQTLQK